MTSDFFKNVLRRSAPVATAHFTSKLVNRIPAKWWLMYLICMICEVCSVPDF
jgi:hypothetical protein